MPKLKIKLPKDIANLPEKDRQEILGVLAQAMRLPPVLKTTRDGGDEHNMWERNTDPLMADAEDDFYEALIRPAQEMIADVFVALDLPLDGVDMEKAFSDEFREYEALLKSKNSGKQRISDLIQANREKRDKFLKYIQSMNPFSKEQLKKLDQLMKKKLPDYAKVAEAFMVRAGFIGKIRNQAEREMFETMGALIDRFPTTIQAAQKQGVVLTLREKEKAEGAQPTKRTRKASSEGREVKILPLTPQETRVVQHATLHAADKLTEISERHRAEVRQLILRAQRERWTAQKLAQALFDAYGDQNRDWRRVAITELSFAANDAYLSGVDEGETVWVPPVDGSCKYCKQLLEGKTFTVTHELPKETYEHEMNYVWAGKSNYGRKVSAWIPCIPLHPNCRHRYHRLSRFYKIVDGQPVLKTTAELIQEERARRGLPPDPNLK